MVELEHLTDVDRQIVEVVSRQIGELEAEIGRVEEQIVKRGKGLRGRKRLRTIATRAVLSMAGRTKTPLMEFYEQKKREKGAGKAICAAACKLVVVIFVMLKKGLDYW